MVAVTAGEDEDATTTLLDGTTTRTLVKDTSAPVCLLKGACATKINEGEKAVMSLTIEYEIEDESLELDVENDGEAFAMNENVEGEKVVEVDESKENLMETGQPCKKPQPHQYPTHPHNTQP